MNDIEKAARLMGYERDGDDGYWFRPIGTTTEQIESGAYPVCVFNPRTNKADLMDVETELGIDIRWNKGFVMASTRAECWYESFKDHPTKFAARSEAVIAVAVQIYDRREG